MMQEAWLCQVSSGKISSERRNGFCPFSFPQAQEQPYVRVPISKANHARARMWNMPDYLAEDRWLGKRLTARWPWIRTPPPRLFCPVPLPILPAASIGSFGRRNLALP